MGGPLADSGLSAAEIRDIVLNGTGTMPGFAAQLSHEEVEALVGYTAELASGVEFGTGQQAPAATGDPELSAATAPAGSDASPVPVIVISLLAGLGAAAASVLWARSGRKLTN